MVTARNTATARDTVMATAMVTVSRPVTRRNRKVNNNNELIIMEKNGTVTRTGVSVEESEQVIFDGMNAFERNVKRMGDCALAFLALIVFSPLFLLCYIAVKREDGGRRSLGKSVSVVSVARSTSISSAVCVWTRRSSVRPFTRVGQIPG